MAQYGQPDYWDKRYTSDPEPFEWYQRWAGLKNSLMSVLSPESQILVVGCGNSRLSEEMYEEGYKSIMNCDISNVVVNYMTEKCQDRPGLQFKHVDCRKMDFADGSYNVVVDKGTLDSILCGEGSANNAHKLLSEVSRVLAQDGVFVCISHGQPQYRMSYLQKGEFGWSVKVVTVPKPMVGVEVVSIDDKENVHYIYICQKSAQNASSLEDAGKQ